MEPSIPRAAERETFSRNANGVRAIYVLPAFSPTPLALGLNVKGLIHGRARYIPRSPVFRLRQQLALCDEDGTAGESHAVAVAGDTQDAAALRDLVSQQLCVMSLSRPGA